MGVVLREKTNTSGKKSLYLDINQGGRRWKEYLNLTIEPGTSPDIKAKNKNTYDIAKRLRNNRENEQIASDTGIKQPHKLKNILFSEYFEKVKSIYPNKDLRLVIACKSYYDKFIIKYGYEGLKISEVNQTVCEEFLNFIKQHVKGETVLNYYTKFKYVLLKAMKEGIISTNPAENIRVSRDGGIKKEILSLKEIRQMADTDCSNQEVKRAFLFSCFTGLRWVDVKALKKGQFDYEAGFIKVTQKKTQGSSGVASITVPITDTVLNLIPCEPGASPDDLVFTLPSHSYSTRFLKLWADRAGIKKNISWHCSRHTYAVLLLTEAKTDVKTAASLLGHSGLKHFEKYTRAVDELRVKAANKINL